MKRSTILYLLVSVLAASCTKDITSLNYNSKAAATVPSSSLFLNGEKNLSDALTGTADGATPFRVLAQSWTENTYVAEAQYNLTSNNSPEGWWELLYATTSANPTASILNSLADAKTIIPTDITDTAAQKNALLITDILEVYAYSLLVNTYGNVPYSQALNSKIPFPAYDDAKTIYYDLLARLDTAIAALNTNGLSFGASDNIYQGNVASWKKFAATLKLKLALVIADVDPSTAGTKVQEAVNAGVFTSNKDNALFVYSSAINTNSNPVYQAFISRHDYSPANLIVNTLLAWQDPRLPLMFTEVGDTAYVGGVPGAGNGYVKLSQFSSQWLSPSWPGDLLDYAETEFLLAEAVERGFAVNGTAASHYNNGVTASINFWGADSAAATTYLAQPSVAYATAAGTWKQKIGYQQWLAYADRGWDAWTSIRRLGYPNLDAINPPVGAVSNLPRRFTYPSSEETINPTNWAAAVQAVTGGASDGVNFNLWWNK
jgi:Starch-binding associating with outer membrane